MKHNKFFPLCTAWLFLTIITLSAFRQKEPVTIIAGILPDNTNETLTLVPVDEFFSGLTPVNKNLPTVQTDSLGNFSFRCDNLEPGFYLVTYKNNWNLLDYDLYIEKGDSLYIALNRQSATFSISGNGAAKLQHLVNDNKLYPKNNNYYNTIRGKGFKTEMHFKSFIDSLFNQRISTVQSNKKVPEPLKRHFINGIYAEKATTLLEHLEDRNNTMNTGNGYYYPDTSYYSFLNEINFDDGFCRNSGAKSLAQIYLTNKARHAFRYKDENAWWDENFTWKLNYVQNQPRSTWNDLLAMSLIRDYSMAMFNEGFFQNIQAFDEKAATVFKKENYQLIFKQNSALFLNLAPGKPAPDFALPDPAGKMVKLSDFKGKIVYIDFWGTWCGPCIAEIPDALKLQDDYKDKPVVFLYVAMESDQEDIANWRRFISEKKEEFDNRSFTGIHVVAENQRFNKEIKPYQINFAPTNVLIDHKGNMVNPRAARANKISKELDKLLGQMDN